MRRTFMLTAALTVALIATSITAQTAIRCEVDGRVVYGDSACAPGSTGKAIAPMQETAEQRAASKAANEQIRKDNAAVDKRMDDRFKRDTTRPAAVIASTANAKLDKAGVDARGESKRKSVKAKKSKKSSNKAAAKAPKNDNRSYRPAPKA